MLRAVIHAENVEHLADTVADALTDMEGIRDLGAARACRQRLSDRKAADEDDQRERYRRRSPEDHAVLHITNAHAL